MNKKLIYELSFFETKQKIFILLFILNEMYTPVYLVIFSYSN